MCSLENLSSGLFGGLAGGLMTYFAVKLTLSAQREESSQLHKRTHRSMALSLQSEIQENWKRYKDSAGEAFDKWIDGQRIDGFFLAEEHYFSIYEGQASSIGEIDDDRLRNLIVETYTIMKGHLDSLRINNRVSHEISIVDLNWQAGASRDARLRDLKTAAQEYARVLNKEQKNISAKVKEICPLLEAYAEKIQTE